MLFNNLIQFHQHLARAFRVDDGVQPATLADSGFFIILFVRFMEHHTRDDCH
jgi:hypothetical protein